LWGNPNIPSYHQKYNIFRTWKNPENVASGTEFCGATVHSLLTQKIGVSLPPRKGTKRILNI